MTDWKEQLQEAKEGMQVERLQGKLRTLRKGYGFIRVYPEGQPRRDYFFHKTDLQGVGFEQLESGDILSFDEGRDEIGLKAENVLLEQERHLIKNTLKNGGK